MELYVGIFNKLTVEKRAFINIAPNCIFQNKLSHSSCSTFKKLLCMTTFNNVQHNSKAGSVS